MLCIYLCRRSYTKGMMDPQWYYYPHLEKPEAFFANFRKIVCYKQHYVYVVSFIALNLPFWRLSKRCHGYSQPNFENKRAHPDLLNDENSVSVAQLVQKLYPLKLD